MVQIQALSKDTIRVKSEDRSEEISAGDRLRFKSEFGMYEQDEILSVVPEIGANDEYFLKSWSDSKSIHYIGEELISEFISEDIVDILTE